ncbi:MAG: hypothetical protein AAF648_13675 [Pseudomonadota bacterium]
MIRSALMATLCTAVFITAPAHAGLISVTGGLSNLGDAAMIITPPSDVSDDAATNRAMQGFDEMQGVTLASDLAVDGGMISSGMTVSSHMLFLNTSGNTRGIHNDVVWTFDGMVLGVMSDSRGMLEAASSAILGAAGTFYPGSFGARGFENGSNSGDSYSVSGNSITVSMRVTEPGDWIRVVTATPVSEPGALSLIGLGLFALGGMRRRRVS